MVSIQIIATGKLKESYLKEGIAEYKKRISGYANFTITEVTDEQIPSSLKEGESLRIRETEGRRILEKIGQNDAVILLDLSGNPYSSEELAHEVSSMIISGKNRIVFIIGGTLGVSKEVLERADRVFALSNLTLPHQIARLLLAEQIYRIFRIINNEPYHR